MQTILSKSFTYERDVTTTMMLKETQHVYMERVSRLGETTDSGNGKNDGWNKGPENRG